jgi:16S rRNA (uracil1498-N3)-methyltransferase
VHRFFAPSLDPGDELVTLPKDEAEHLTRVLRIGTGENVAVFDGRGNEFLARVLAAARRDVRLQLLSRLEPAREWGVHVTLVQAVLKADRMDDVVRDAVMLGVSAVQPVVTRRTEATVAQVMRGSRADRWRRIALASAKQCRRAVVPDVHMPLPFDACLAEPSPDLRLLLVEPSAAGALPLPVQPIRCLRERPIPSTASVWIGPEGGWDPRELTAAAERGVALVSLGHRTLRADAAPLSVLSILTFVWDI